MSLRACSALKEPRQSAERIAREEREHQQRMAHDERVQKWRAETYVETLEFVTWVMEIVDRR